jgi:hypothetical protein
MNYIIKNIFYSVWLIAIIALLLATNIPDFVIGVLFLISGFFISLSAGSQSFTLARLPFLFIAGWFLFFYLTPIEVIGSSFLAVIGAAFFLTFSFNNYFSSLFKALPNITQEDLVIFLKKYELARSLVLALLLLIAFLWYTDAFIIYLVLGLPFYIALLMIFFITFFLTSYILKIYSMSDKIELNEELLLYAWTSGLVISEMSWIVGFWPFGYLTAAFIITIIYYTIISILKEYLFGEVSKKDVISNLAFAIIIIIIIFNYTNWLPL